MNSSTDTYLSVVGSYELDPNDAAAFAKIAAESVAETVNKAGCLYYIFSQDIVKPGVFHLSEGWKDQAALDNHSNSPDFKQSLEQALKLRMLSRTIYLSESKNRTLVS